MFRAISIVDKFSFTNFVEHLGHDAGWEDRHRGSNEGDATCCRRRRTGAVEAGRLAAALGGVAEWS